MKLAEEGCPPPSINTVAASPTVFRNSAPTFGLVDFSDKIFAASCEWLMAAPRLPLPMAIIMGRHNRPELITDDSALWNAVASGVELRSDKKFTRERAASREDGRAGDVEETV